MYAISSASTKAFSVLAGSGARLDMKTVQAALSYTLSSLIHFGILRHQCLPALQVNPQGRSHKTRLVVTRRRWKHGF